jgi:hypothetical protein
VLCAVAGTAAASTTHMVRQVSVQKEYKVAAREAQPVHICRAQPELAGPRPQELHMPTMPLISRIKGTP